MKHLKKLINFTLAITLPLFLLPAMAQETLVNYVIINKGNTTIASHLQGVPDVLPNAISTFTDSRDLKISSMKNGESSSAGKGFVFSSGEKSCEFFDSITVTKKSNITNFSTNLTSMSTGKQLTACEIKSTKEPARPPYSYNLELTMH
ncbi:hypothetical protein [Pseudomonas vancouverensis]|uniref:Uncharacterized protein n=1 Tax=Pseudomonas vancouverensis TaxID=95300 RepID=A0A1H2P6I7_PSEVA|nr:hypothetical protein [Pseudomonas vancouverensis]KAB0499977.1 hypothetical protein F7R09_02055 [Pseudomonas vancouverensis]TDB68466.1 hypothetical protein EIY72_01025 [Pseudomonas vancouverensis]SDV13312.1 hypothetical protein SAMN05216558_3855 [Pseudomonas vancouverensis]